MNATCWRILLRTQVRAPEQVDQARHMGSRLAPLLTALGLLAGVLPILGAAPVITNQPASQTIFYGDAVTFRVGASGTAPLSYLWHRNGVPISSAQASTYTLSNVSSNDNGATFFVVVTNSSGSVRSETALLEVDFGNTAPAGTLRLLEYNSTWRYKEDENLDGVNWTAPEYDDSAWGSGPGLLAFENNPEITPLIGTYLGDPRTPAAGLSPGRCSYFRTTVTIPGDINAVPLFATARCDDGAFIYIQGAPSAKIRMPDAADLNLTFATVLPPSGDATADDTITDFSGAVLNPGTNVIAVSVHQQNSGSSDTVWGMALDVQTYQRVRDTTAPVLTDIVPAPGSTVSVLNQLEVHFSEPVRDVKASDLLIGAVPATNVTAYAQDVYVFDFPQPPTGLVQIAWSPAQAIVDRSANSNRFAAWSFSLTLNPGSVANSVLLTEFMAGNASGIRDEDGNRSDWIELFNAGDQTVNIGRWYLTDNPGRLAKWQFPLGVNIPSKSYLLVWASGKDRTNAAAPLHTNFKLDKAAGNYLGLVYSDGATVVSSFSPYPQQYDDVSYGRDRLDPALVGYFTNATPRAANATIGANFGPEVKFSVSGCTFRQAFDLTLSTDDTNAVIYFLLTTNGTTAAVGNIPTTSSFRYTGPIAITNSMQVRARAFSTRAGYWPGPARNESYLMLALDATGVTSDLPLVVLHNLGGGTLDVTTEKFTTIQVFETRNGRSCLTNPPDLSVQGYVHYRGQTTIGPRNLRVETQDAYGDNLDVDLLGLPSENDWVFYGPDVYDKGLIHNPLAHELYREMGHYTSRTRLVEVYLKTAAGTATPLTRADYSGIYVIEEKIKLGKNRVDVDKLQPENTNAPSITGGYLLSIDKSNPGSPEYMAGASIWYLDPDYYEITSAMRASQRQYIIDYFNSFYSALIGPNWTDPVTGYAAYIDLSSWIDYHLHNTFTFNVDALRISAYFTKPRDGKIVQGPLWDFDRSQGTSGGDDRGFNPRRWRSGMWDGGTDFFNENCSIFCNPWYGKMFNDPDFWQKWIDRYQELRRSVYSLTNLYARIDGFANQLRQSTSRSYARWSDTSPRAGAYSGDGFTYTFPSPGTWDGEVNFLKAWYSNRVDFIDGNFLNPPVFSNNGGPVSPGFVLTITAPTREANSTIYYTLDGTDPRLPGGGISPNARSALNTATFSINSNVRVFARNYNLAHFNLTGANNPPLNSYWSGPMVASFVVSTPPLAITEIMYNPPWPASGTNDNDAFEFIELKNRGTQTLNLIGFRFTNGIDFTFTSTNAISNLTPGAYLVLARNRAAFQSRYPTVTNIAGEYAAALNNGGERIALEGPLGEPILNFHYDNSWCPATDGSGFSLVIRDENAPFNTWSNSTNWRASSYWGGSPGKADPAPANIIPVVINEALTHTDPPEVDTVELYNPTQFPAPIGGWFLTDDAQVPAKYRIPDGTVVAPGCYALITENQFNNNGTNSFALSSLGDAVYLFSGDGVNLTGYRHGFQFGPQVNGVTFGRCVTSDGKEHFVTERGKTLGLPNAGPKVGPIVINEIMYAPPPFGLDADTVDEYVELRNLSTLPAPLFDLQHPTNAWKLAGAIQFTFPLGLYLPPRSFLLLVSFDPSQDPASVAWFRNQYGLSESVPLFGPFQGHLANEGERIGLYLPDKPEPLGSPDAGYVPYVLAEEVHYSSQPPWPAGTLETGKSLQRLASAAFADDPANWLADAPSPGRSNPGASAIDSDGDTVPDEIELLIGTDPLNSRDYMGFDRVYINGASCVLEFTAHAGVVYAVEKRDSLNPADPWTILQDNLSGGGVVAVQDPLPVAARFYRLRAIAN
ncbi:MAG TPA: lamin tail domain-containing protein [Verrucomicrobiae bacterium]